MAQTVGRSPVTKGWRIRDGNVVALVARAYQTGLAPFGSVRVVYDDGTEDDLYFDPSQTTTEGSNLLAVTRIARKDGWVVGGCAGLQASGVSGRATTAYGQILIGVDLAGSVPGTRVCIGQGHIGAFQVISVGQFGDPDFRLTWVFQGTVLEDATAGTHVSTLTVTPGAGNELVLSQAQVIAGAGASNVFTAVIDDGTNEIVRLSSVTLASGDRSALPGYHVNTTTGNPGSANPPLIISGTMRLILRISTATVSLTHTFAVACRLKGGSGLPTATLADTVGTPTLTTNTNAVFG